MTEPRRFTTDGEPAPLVQVEPLVRAAAGSRVTVDVTVTNTADEARVLSVVALGVDSGWVPGPQRTAALPPGGTARISLLLSPAAGTFPAQYPLAVTAQALDPGTDRATAPPGMTNTLLVVNPRVQIAMELVPADLVVTRSKRFAVLLSNDGPTPTRVRLDTQHSTATRVELRRPEIDLPPGETIRVKGRATVTRPRLAGQRVRHSFVVSARGPESVRHVDGALTQRALIGPGWVKAAAVLAILGVWIAAGLVFIPQIASKVGSSDTQSATIDGNGSGGSDSGSGGDGSGSGGGDDTGGDSGGGDGSSGDQGSDAAGAADTQEQVLLNGTVTAADPADVQVTLEPTSLVDEEAVTATPVGVPAALLSTGGMVPASTMMLTAVDRTPPDRSARTTTDGSWSFPEVQTPGYYLLSFSRPGYQTQRFVVDSSTSDAKEPLEVDLVPGEGRLSGVVTGPDGGRVGGAEIRITDGTNTLTTSSNTKGNKGAWSVTGLSTPASYIVEASSDGLSMESQLVRLPAGDAATVNLRLRYGVATLAGRVRADNLSGKDTGLGGATVSVSDGKDVNLTATSITEKPRGTFTVPGLPVPGTYTVRIGGEGFQSQTSKLVLGKGQSKARLTAGLVPSTGVLTGRVENEAGRVVSGAGMTLSNSENTYKTVTTNATSSGSGRASARSTGRQRGTGPVNYRFNGITPGVYVLSTQLYAFTTNYVTVRIQAGVETPLDLEIRSQGGEVVPATAQIRGSVIDAATQEEVKCRGVANCLEATVEDPRKGDPDDDPTTYSDEFQPQEQYLLPEKVTAAAGLLPGVHVVQVTAPHYESARTTVQVPIGGVVQAPTIPMFPSPKIQGEITAAIGAPGTETCVWAVPLGDTSKLPDCAAAVADDTCTPTDASYDDTSLDPEPVCASVTGVGTYSIEVAEHGTYTVQVVPSDPEYLDAQPATLVLARGATQTYSVQLHRYGRLLVNVLKPGPSGVLVPSGNTTVSVDPAPLISPWPATDPDTGVTLITGLKPDVYELKATDAADAELEGSITQSVGYDQEFEVDLPLTNPISSLVGRVSANIDGEQLSIGGAAVSITAVYRYGGTQPYYTTVNLKTDPTGCFAIQSGAQPPALPPCDTSWPEDSLQVQELLSNTAESVTITAPGYVPYQVSNRQLSSLTLNDFSLEPQPVTFSGTIRTAPAKAITWGQVGFQVESGSGGTNTISVSAAPSGDPTVGTLTWNDTRYPGSNQIRPGTYKLTATLSGYKQTATTITCAVNGSCTFSNPLVLEEDGGLTISAVDSASAPVNGAVFTLLDNNTPVRTLTAATNTSAVTFSNLEPGRTTYTVRIQAAGFAFGVTGAGVGITCGAGGGIVIAPGVNTPCTATLTRLGAISGTVSGVLGRAPATEPTRQLAGARVNVQRCTAPVDATTTCTATGGPTFSAITDGNGAFQVTGTTTEEGLAAGPWLVTTEATGYTEAKPAGALAGTVVQVSAGSTATATPLVYVDPVQFTAYLRDASGKVVRNATMQLLQGGTTVGSTLTGTGNDSRYVFTSVIPGRYTLQASGTGLVTSTVQVDIVVGEQQQTYNMSIGRGANVARGTVKGDDTGAGLDGVTVTMRCANPAADPDNCPTAAALGTDGKPLTATTSAGGFEFRTVPDGTYTLTFAKYGYRSSTTSGLVFDHTLAAVPPLDITLGHVSHNVTVTVRASNPADDLTGATVNLAPVAGGGNTAPAGQLLAGSGGTFTTTFNQVRFGCWNVSLTLPADRRGTVSALIAPATEAPLNCTSNLTVPGTGGDPVTASYDVTESEIRLTVTAAPLTGHSPPTSAVVRLTGGPGGPITLTGFPLASATSIWLRPGPWTINASPDGTVPSTFWPTPDPATITLSPTASGTRALALLEVTGVLAVRVTGAGAGTPAAPEATITLTPGPGQTAPVPAAYAAPIRTVDGARNFTLPSGRWTLSVVWGTFNDSSTVNLTVLSDTFVFTPP